MRKQFIALALLVAASVASDATSITAQPSIATDAHIIPAGEGPAKDDIAHQVYRRHERRGFAQRVQAEQEAKKREQPQPQQQQPQQQCEPSAPQPPWAQSEYEYTPQPQQQYQPSAPQPSSAPSVYEYTPQPQQQYQPSAPQPSWAQSEYGYTPQPPQPEQRYEPYASYGAQPSAYERQHKQELQPQDERFNFHGAPPNRYEERPSPIPFEEPSRGPFSFFSPTRGAQRSQPPHDPYRRMLEEKLQATIDYKKLGNFYGNKNPTVQRALKKVVDRLVEIDFDRIAKDWDISRETIYDLAPLALYNIVFFCDDSGSMKFEEGGTRIDDLQTILEMVSSIAIKFDDDGISLRFMNSNVQADNVGAKDKDDVQSIMKDIVYCYTTPLGTQFKSKILQPFVLNPARQGTLEKPVLAIIITDGEPDGIPDEGKIFKKAITDAKKDVSRTYGGGAFAIQIAQVGTNKKAQRFVSALDNDPEIGKEIDATSNYEFESSEIRAMGGPPLSTSMWLLKLCVGAIAKEYDNSDEPDKKK